MPDSKYFGSIHLAGINCMGRVKFDHIISSKYNNIIYQERFDDNKNTQRQIPCLGEQKFIIVNNVVVAVVVVNKNVMIKRVVQRLLIYILRIMQNDKSKFCEMFYLHLNIQCKKTSVYLQQLRILTSEHQKLLVILTVAQFKNSKVK